MFQSAPLTEARGDEQEIEEQVAYQCFNPLPSPKQGETLIQPTLVVLLLRFQSAPLTEARGDWMAWVMPPLLFWFQSAPLTEARGDSTRLASQPANLSVSIRSPHRSKGRLIQLYQVGRL